MTTLEREARKIVEGILIPALSDNPQTQEAIDYAKEQARKVVDALLRLRGFAFLTDEEVPEYEVKRGSDEWKKKLGSELAETSIEAAIYAGTKVTQTHVNKQQEVFELETMIDEQLARLPLNWTGFQEDKEKEKFRKWLKKERKEYGRELKKWVDWWMSDEWRVANPPWKLSTIKIKWLEAFKNETKKAEVKTDANNTPMSY